MKSQKIFLGQNLEKQFKAFSLARNAYAHPRGKSPQIAGRN